MRKTSLISTPLHRRAMRRRAGSILILVVAVLVLLALMGTAFMSTARLDRLAAGPANSATTDEVIEQLVPTVSDMARQTILDDIAALAMGYRPPPVQGSQYDHWDDYLTNYREPVGAAGSTYQTQNDAWIAPRIPWILNEPSSGNPRPYWRSISRPLNQPTTGTGGEILFETPYIDPATVFPATTTPPWLAGYTGGTWTFDPKVAQLAVTDLAITYPATHPDPGLAGKTRVFPAFQIADLTGGLAPDQSGRQYKILAGDADGDGLADSGLVYMTTVDGVRYYYAIRIVDENSAININTAWSMEGDFASGATTPSAPGALAQPSWVFPGSIGLRELLTFTGSGAQEIDVINAYRLNSAGPIATPMAPVADPYPTGNAAARPDYLYLSQMEAQYEMLGRRVDYPGWRVPSTPPATGYDPNRYQAFALDRHLDLSYHFAYVNPDTDQTAAGGTDTLDRRLHTQGGIDAIYRSSLNWADDVNNRFRFLPTDKWQYWSQWNFTFDPVARANGWSMVVQPTDGPLPAIPTNIRSLLTAYNGVSNSIIKHSVLDADVAHSAMLPYAAKGRWELGYSTNVGYKQGDIVIHTWFPYGAGTTGITEPFLCVADYQGTGRPDNTAANWVRMQARGDWEAAPIGGAYARGNVVTAPALAPAGAARNLYVLVTNAAGGTAPWLDTANWFKIPAGAVPPKVSLNTAPFAELFRGFWNVMKSDFPAQATPFDADIASNAGGANDPAYVGNVLADPRGTNFPPTFNYPYVGNRFFDYYAVGGAGGAAPFEPDLLSYPAGPGIHPAKMFRSPIRAVPDLGGNFSSQTPRLPADQVMLLRAALAAVNAEDLRDADSDITAREIILQTVVDTGGDGNATYPADVIPVSCVVYGHEPQPYITEVYANTDNVRDFGSGVNPNGYVAIELYNPYPIPINMTNWVLAACPRRAQAGYPADTDRDMTVLADFGVAGDAAETYPLTGDLASIPILTIPAYGYMILENHPSTVVPVAAGSAASRPPSAGIIGTTRTSGQIQVPVGTPVVTVFVPGLGDNGGPLALRTVTDNELVILRPRRSDGTYSYATAGGTDGKSTPYPSRLDFDERLANVNRLRDLVPVDSFDFSNLVLPGGVSSDAYCWHYVRRNDTPSGGAFHFVYPGRYNAGNLAPLPRQAGTQYTNSWTAGDPLNDPWDPTIGGFPPGHPQQPPPNPPNPLGPSMTFGTTFVDGSPDYTQPAMGIFSNVSSSLGNQVSRPIQLSNYHFDDSGAVPGGGSSVGHNLLYEGLPVRFPFGGFMRNGDVMHVPFIGAYRILDPTDRLNAGGTLLEINAITMDAAMAEDTYTINDGAVTLGAYTEYVEQVGRFCPPWNATQAGIGGAGYAYAWASDILDQFTAIQNFHDDFLPNTDPARHPPSAPAPTPVANLPGARPNTLADRDAPVQGSININTAPVEVLARVPLVITAAGAMDVAQTRALAQAIVLYRDVNDGTGQPHGAFKSLFELNNVVTTGSNGFYDMAGQLNFAATPSGEPDDLQGDFSPFNSAVATGQPTGDQVRLDYEERYLNVMRLSNLLTTRSDVFKAYVLVQGWKNTGTEHPQLVAERRAALIIDRSKTASDNTTLNVLTVPSR